MSPRPKHVTVIGAGAMGSLFGGLLAEGDLEVTLVDVWQDHVDRINRDGLKIVGYGGDRSVEVKATIDAASIAKADVALVQTKALHTRDAVTAARTLFDNGAVAVSFQNGLGNEDVIAEVIGRDKVLGGVTAQGANIEGPGVVRNHGDLASYIGELDGGVSPRAEAIAAAFSGAGLKTAASDNVMREIWRKLMANIGVSSFSALCHCPVGRVFDAPETKTLIFAAVDEAAAVGNAAGIDLDVAQTRGVLNEITGAGGTGTNWSSLAVDIKNGRRTEIDFINGAVVRLGRELGVPTPINETLVGLVKGLEQRVTSKGLCQGEEGGHSLV